MLIYEIDRNLFRAECEARGRAKGKAEGKAEIIEEIVVNALKENCSLVLLSKITQTSIKKIKTIAKKHKIKIDE
ncbi:MAG: hypothetical protein MR514_04270 [Succinivibrio sp.]|nr:hypothetical protein [Succinivibrio sp.]MCI7773058.1 hypothetical protein [Succinivibrio sp.]MDD7287255.1 hypothetical protein [Succinivibrio sp.]MDY5903488.1 hypothetical protein [Succinivibrio sp.]HAO91981.1 hypothetical protein [Succinivibrio sp.]